MKNFVAGNAIEINVEHDGKATIFDPLFCQR